MAWPEAIITTFVIQLCSLFDRGQDCIVVRTYEAKLRQGGKDTAQSTDLIEQAETMINPLRDIRDNYYAHRLAEGAMSDLIEANGLTNDRLFEIYESVRDAVQGLLKLDEDEDAEFQENDPVPDLNRMITDLTAFDQQG